MNHAMDRIIVLPWWRRKRWTRLFVAGAVLLVCVTTLRLFLGTTQGNVRLSLTNVTIATVSHGTFHDFVPIHAKIVPLKTIYLDALEGGRVEQILAQAGDAVTKGQPLVELSNTELELDVLDREGRLIESITQLQSYETQLEQNRIANVKALSQIDYDTIRLNRSLTRRKLLADKGLESQETRDSMQDELNHVTSLRPLQAESNRRQEDLRVRQLPQIDSQIAKLQDDVKITHSKLDNLIVRAPVTGRITAMDLKVGENRNRGERFAEITADGGFKLSADVDEYYLRRVRAGQTAVVDVGDKSFQVEVARVYPQVKNGTFAVDLAFRGTHPEGLLPGQAVQGTLSLGADTMATIVPTGPFLERTGGDWIFVLDPSSHFAQRRSVHLGRRNAEQMEVLENLSVGERVIVSDYSGLEHSQQIELEK